MYIHTYMLVWHIILYYIILYYVVLYVLYDITHEQQLPRCVPGPHPPLRHPAPRGAPLPEEAEEPGRSTKYDIYIYIYI